MSSYIDKLKNGDAYYCFDDYFGHHRYGYLKMLPEESNWEDQQGEYKKGSSIWSDGRPVLDELEYHEVLVRDNGLVETNTREPKKPKKDVALTFTKELFKKGSLVYENPIQVLKPIINLQPHMAFPIGTTVWIGGHIEAKIDEILVKSHYTEYLCIWFTNSEKRTMWCAAHHFTFEKQNTPVGFITE